MSAANTLTLKLQSYATGTGFKSVAKSTKDLAENAKRGALAMQNLGSVFGQVDGTAGKLLEGVSNLAGSFMQGGVLAVAITGITAEISALISKFKELRKAWDDLDAASKTNITTAEQLIGAQNRLLKSIEAHKSAKLWQEVATETEYDMRQVAAIEQLTGAYSALSGAKAKAASGAAAIEVQRLTNEFNERMRAAANELESGVIAAERDMALALLNGKNAVNAAAEATDVEKSKRDSLVDAIALQEKVVANLNYAGKDATAAEKKLTELKGKLQLQEESLTSAAQKEELERLKLAEAERAGAYAVEQAKDAAAKEAEKREKVATKLESSLDDLDRNKAAYADLSGKIDTMTKEAQQHTQNAKDIRAAQKETSDSLQAASKYYKSMDGTAYSFDIDKNGNIGTFKDFQRASRYGERAAREEAANKSMWDNMDQETADKVASLQERLSNGKKISDSDQKLLDQWKKYQDQKKDAAKEDALAKKANEAVVKMQAELSEIKKNLKQALTIS